MAQEQGEGRVGLGGPIISVYQVQLSALGPILCRSEHRNTRGVWKVSLNRSVCDSWINSRAGVGMFSVFIIIVTVKTVFIIAVLLYYYKAPTIATTSLYIIGPATSAVASTADHFC